jgi:dienelactone hydrolase
MAAFWETIKVDGEDMQLYVTVPAGKGPFPAVVVIQHQGGIRPIRGRHDTARCRCWIRRRSPGDVNATVDFLKGHPAIDGARLGIVGFCMGGRVAYFMPAVNPNFKAAVSYYGGGTMIPWGEGPSPFDRTAEIQCPLMGLFGEEDTNPSPADMRKLDVELTRLGKVHEFYSYPGANHAFMNKHGNRYHADADRDSWPKALAFFEKHVRQAAVAAG